MYIIFDLRELCNNNALDFLMTSKLNLSNTVQLKKIYGLCLYWILEHFTRTTSKTLKNEKERFNNKTKIVLVQKNTCYYNNQNSQSIFTVWNPLKFCLFWSKFKADIPAFSFSFWEPASSTLWLYYFPGPRSSLH